MRLVWTPPAPPPAAEEPEPLSPAPALPVGVLPAGPAQGDNAAVNGCNNGDARGVDGGDDLARSDKTDARDAEAAAGNGDGDRIGW